MPTHEAIINGYVRDRRKDRSAGSADDGSRTPFGQARQEARFMVPQYSAVGSRPDTVDTGVDRHVVNRRSGRIRRRSPSQIFDAVLTVACYAAWGGLLIAIPVVVLVKAAERL